MKPLQVFFLTFLLLSGTNSALSLPNRWYDDPLNPHLRDFWRLLDPSVLYDSSTHVFSLWATDDTYLLRAVSLNGREWYYSEEGSQNLVEAFGVYAVLGVEVVRADSGYYMYYTASMYKDAPYHIGLAMSRDGKTWEKLSSSLFVSDASLTWPLLSGGLGYPKVVRTPSGYLMCFAGGDGKTPGTGVATSVDGITWTMYKGNPILTPHFGLDAGGTGCAALEYAHETFFLMYEAVDSLGKTAVGMATSADGFAWTKSANNPAIPLGPAGSWNSGRLGGGAMRFANDAYHFWYSAQQYSGSGWQMGYASSAAANVDQVTTGVRVPFKTDGMKPAESSLLQNYPNPFNPGTEIAYTVHGSPFTVHSTDVKLTVYDLLGREAATLVNEKQAPGRYTVKFDGKRLASGLYLYRLQAGNHVETKRMLLLK